MEHPKYLFNTKSLFAHLMNTIEKLDRNEIDVATASAVSKLHNSAQGWLNYELKKSIISATPEAKEHMRNIELKNFDSLPQ